MIKVGCLFASLSLLLDSSVSLSVSWWEEYASSSLSSLSALALALFFSSLFLFLSSSSAIAFLETRLALLREDEEEDIARWLLFV